MFLAHAIPQKDIASYKKTFDAFDRENSGRVPKELLEPLLRSLGYNPYPYEVEDMIKDLGRDSWFDFDSFMVIVARHSRNSKPDTDLADIFRTISKDQGGRVSLEFVKNTLMNIPNELTEYEIDELLKSVKVDDDGFADVDDVANAMLGL